MEVFGSIGKVAGTLHALKSLDVARKAAEGGQAVKTATDAAIKAGRNVKFDELNAVYGNMSVSGQEAFKQAFFAREVRFLDTIKESTGKVLPTDAESFEGFVKGLKLDEKIVEKAQRIDTVRSETLDLEGFQFSTSKTGFKPLAKEYPYLQNADKSFPKNRKFDAKKLAKISKDLRQTWYVNPSDHAAQKLVKELASEADRVMINTAMKKYF